MEKCNKCNQEKQMYFKPWCPKCEPPKIKTKEVINFIQTLDHLEAIGHKGISERLWDLLLDFIPRNDSLFHYTFIDIPKDDDLKILKEFIGRDEIIFDVSW